MKTKEIANTNALPILFVFTKTSYFTAFKLQVKSNIVNEDYFFSGANISFLDLLKKINKDQKKHTYYIKIPNFIILTLILLFQKFRFIIKTNLNMTYHKAKINLNFGTFCNNDKAKKNVALPNSDMDEMIAKWISSLK